MNTFGRLVVSFAIGWAALAGCSDEKPKPAKVIQREPPVITAHPEPGTYDELSLDIEIGSEEPGLVYFYGLDREPTLEDGEPDKLRLRLNRSATVLVSVRDADGELWGPYSFAYTLQAPVAAASCSVAMSNGYYHRPSETLTLEVDYAFAFGISLLYFAVDGNEELVGGPATLDPQGVLEVPVAPIAGEGVHSLACIIRNGDEITATNATEVYIDGTPPTGAWLTTGGAFARATWPADFRLQAADGGSGIASVMLCKTGVTPCLEIQSRGSDVFGYATVLTAGSAFQTSLTPVITDRAGNQKVLAALTVDTATFGEPPPAAPLAVTLVTGATIDLGAVVLAAGRSASIAEVKSPDLSVAYDAAALPLAPGWNDFLYRQVGRNEWESFGVYRAGISVAYPASAWPWLVFASQSTTPALQGTLVDVVAAGAGGTWAKAWFDVPHVWFVADRNLNQRWDDGDDLWIGGEAFAGPFQARLAPVDASLTLTTGSTPTTDATKTVVCAVCDAAGELYFEWRPTSYAYPASHQALPLVSFAPFTDATVAVWHDASGRCSFFWDENTDGVANGAEPRAFGPCGDGSFVLAKQAALAASVANGVVRVTGVPYGGMATGELRVELGATVLQREAWQELRDVNGTGAVTAAVKSPMNLPYILRVSSGTEVTTLTLPFAPPAESVWLRVEDENGDPVSAVGVVQRGATAYGTVFDAAGGQVAVGLPPEQDGLEARAFALREGYVSVEAPVTGSAMPVRILSSAVTGRVIGTIRDRYGAAISNATLTWKAQAYRARALSNSQGEYALPTSGYSGVVHVSAPGPIWRETYFPISLTQETRVQDVVLADGEGPSWPLGANLGIWPEELLGPYVAPTYIGDRYYAARVTSGLWTVHSSYGMSRQVALPGALPPLSPDSVSRKFPPSNLALAALTQYARCGARLQLDLSYVGAVADSACWGWFATDGAQEYFLGMIDTAAGFPAAAGLGVFNATASGAGTLITLVDVLFGRVIYVPVGTGDVRQAVPVGMYAVYGTGGAAASPAYVTVDANDNPTVELVVP